MKCWRCKGSGKIEYDHFAKSDDKLHPPVYKIDGELTKCYRCGGSGKIKTEAKPK